MEILKTNDEIMHEKEFENFVFDLRVKTDIEAADVKNEIANFLIERYYIKTIAETDEILLYNMKTGLYQEDKKYLVKQIQRILDAAEIKKFSTSSHFVFEIVEVIKRRTYTKWGDIEPPEYLIPFKNYIVDIRPDGNGLIKYSPDYIFFSKLNVFYEENDTNGEADLFLHEVANGDERKKALLYQIIGYCIYRGNPLHRAIVLVGSGANGKSTFLKFLENLLGEENVAHLSLQQLETEKFAIGSLRGKFANIYADLSKTELKSTGRFKNLTSGDPITVEKKFGGTYTLKNSAKFIFSCNEIPLTNDETDAFYRRWVIVPFTATFQDGANANPDKLKEITSEKEKTAVVIKAVKYLNELLTRMKFIDEPDINTKRRLYTALSSTPKAFCQKHLTYTTMDLYEIKSKIYKYYVDFCEKNNLITEREEIFFKLFKKMFPSVEEKRIRISGEQTRVLYGIRYVTDEDF